MNSSEFSWKFSGLPPLLAGVSSSRFRIITLSFIGELASYSKWHLKQSGKSEASVPASMLCSMNRWLMAFSSSVSGCRHCEHYSKAASPSSSVGLSSRTASTTVWLSSRPPPPLRTDCPLRREATLSAALAAPRGSRSAAVSPRRAGRATRSVNRLLLW